MGDFQRLFSDQETDEALYMFKHQLKAFSGDLSTYANVLKQDATWLNHVMGWMLESKDVVLAKHSFYVIRHLLKEDLPLILPYQRKLLDSLFNKSSLRRFEAGMILLHLYSQCHLNETESVKLLQWIQSCSLHELKAIIQEMMPQVDLYENLLKEYIQNYVCTSKSWDHFIISVFDNNAEVYLRESWATQWLASMSDSKSKAVRNYVKSLE